MRAVRAAWLRGGTSKGLYFHLQDLPPAGASRDALLLAALGSPDPSGMQLNGAGGGISSASKVAILSKSEQDGYEVDYLFGQVEIKDRVISWKGSCGNLSAGVGLFALAEGLVAPTAQGGIQQIRVWQVNQAYGMIVHVPQGTDAPLPAPAASSELLTLAGVPGKEPPVYVELLEPHGKRPLLPTGNVVDSLPLPSGEMVPATLVAAGNPTVIVPAAVGGLSGPELPAEMDYKTLLPLVEHLRTKGAELMGVEVTDQPRVAFVSPPAPYTASSGEPVESGEVHLLSRISTPGRIHHAHTGTGSIALACAAGVEGSIPWQCMADSARPRPGEALRIGHPGGVMEVRADVQKNAERGWFAAGAGFDRTARYIMRGDLFVPHLDRAP